MADDHHSEIVIIRRGGHGDHDEHHGGVWKIAFADFMTAMMAFFLVMWLISANDKTRASVARYFNPVRLVDATTQPRGLKDPKKDDSGITASPDAKPSEVNQKETKTEASTKEAPGGAGASESATARDKRLDAALKDNPYVALAEIATSKGPGDIASKNAKAGMMPVIGHLGGEAFRDPFAPPPSPPPGQETTADTEATAGVGLDDLKPENAKSGDLAPNAPKSTDVKPQTAAPAPPADKAQIELKSEILSLLGGKDRDAGGPKVDVSATKEGLVVSLTDTAQFSMFSNGSAVPAKRVVLLMERVAQALKGQKGNIVIRGFTDNKPFRGTRYDNWHLSLDRAQVAHYMLVRGGMPDARISHIEGFADHGPKSGLEPSNPLNRRIEILLKADAT